MAENFFDDNVANPVEELIALIQESMADIKKRLTEIRGQIEQYQVMVNRQDQLNAELANDLRTVADNLDTMPRIDIKNKYDEAIEARFRLATMRGQLDRFEANQTRLEEQQELLATIINTLQGGVVIESENSDDNTDSDGGGINIVRVVQAQEDERQRLARQMHDGPAQSLTNFILQAEICQKLFDRNPDSAAEELGNLKDAASVTFQKVRDFIFDLRPMMLDDLGVVPTVKRYVDSFRDKNDMQVDLEITGEERRLQSYLEVMLFRAIQELMVNARDFAEASRLQVHMDISPTRATAKVQDNGRGFDVEAMFTDEHSDDPRISAMMTLREKYELIDGDVKIDSGDAIGTTVTVEMPVIDEPL